MKIPNNKICSSCKKSLSVDNFYKQGSGLHSWCKACFKKNIAEYYKKNKKIVHKRARDWKRRNRTRTRNYELKYNYGITLEDYNIIFEEQQGCCAVCKTHQSKLIRALAVDHNHKTGKVRGLLCNKCNHALGLLNEDINIMKSLIVYADTR